MKRYKVLGIKMVSTMTLGKPIQAQDISQVEAIGKGIAQISMATQQHTIPLNRLKRR
jgi:hypothetical protein